MKESGTFLDEVFVSISDLAFAKSGALNLRNAIDAQRVQVFD